MSKSSEYYATIKKCAQEKKDIEISNSAPEHASFLLRTFFENAKSEVCIFTGCLDKSVFGNDELIKAAINFLKKDERHQIKIAFQEDLSLDAIKNNIFLSRIFEEEGRKGNIELRSAHKKFSDITNHFTVMDGEAFRYEEDDVTKKAVANFGDSESARTLAEIFDLIVRNSKDIPHPTIIQ